MQQVFENEDFKLSGEMKKFAEWKDDLLISLSNKKRSLLAFFHLTSFPKVTVNLFESREEYNHFLHSLDNQNQMITICYDKVPKNQLFLFLKVSILHAFVHELYSTIYKGRFAKPEWLDEGLAEVLSGEKLSIERDDFAFRNFYLENIVRRDKKIPTMPIIFQNAKERWESREDMQIDSYDLSYLLVHYLVETKNDFYEIIINENRIKELEKTIIDDCLSYYNRKYPVPDRFQDIKNERELMDYMTKNILYGWIDKNKKVTVDSLKDSEKNSRTSSIQDILETKVGTCADKAKFIKYWFDSVGIENKLFCCRAFTEEKIYMHCFVLFHYQENWYHFEQAMSSVRGVYKYKTLEEAIEESASKFLKGFEKRELTEIPYIPSGLTYQELNTYINEFQGYSLEENRSR